MQANTDQATGENALSRITKLIPEVGHGSIVVQCDDGRVLPEPPPKVRYKYKLRPSGESPPKCGPKTSSLSNTMKQLQAALKKHKGPCALTIKVADGLPQSMDLEPLGLS